MNILINSNNMTIWAGGGPMPDELKHAARILTVKEWIKKKNKANSYVVYTNSTPIDSITVNRPYKF